MPENDKRPKRSIFHRMRKASEQPPIEAKAVGRYLQVSPYKVRPVLNAIRGKNVSEALQILEFSNKKGARLVEKILNSAIANAENNFDLNVDSLYVSKCSADDGPRLKRMNPMARGRASLVLKRQSHITIVVRDRSKEKSLKEINTSDESEVQ